MLNRLGKETSGSGILNYHSSHAERLAVSPRLADLYCERNNRPRGLLGKLFGKNKSSRLTFLNMTALVLLFIFYQVAVSRSPAGVWRSEGFHFALSAFARENKSFVSLRITKEDNEIRHGGLPEVILKGGGTAETFMPNLPLKKGEVSYVRTVLPLETSGDEARKIFCRIVFAGKTKDLTVSMKEE